MPAEPSSASGLLLVGKFGGAQGVRGEIRLRSFTQDPLAIAAYQTLLDSSRQRRFRIKKARLLKDAVLIVQVEGVSDRTAAEALTNIDLYIRRDDLPEPDEDEFYHTDLVGLDARLADGTVFGSVLRIENFGAGDILEIRQPDGEEVMLAFTKANVPEIDIAGGFLIVQPPAETEAPPPEQHGGQ
ncbi:MAG: ribosome maturation factor RimM [Hyphomicrobiales bacterium]|nr:ribosome maturation factor RimM [Hyphomicrobiales bacterium]